MTFNIPDKFAPLREQNFRYYIVARFFYIMALRMLTTVAGYKLFQLTRDTYAVGFAGLAEFVPVFSLALYAWSYNRSFRQTNPFSKRNFFKFVMLCRNDCDFISLVRRTLRTTAT
jgi:hypothetical protein